MSSFPEIPDQPKDKRSHSELTKYIQSVQEYIVELVEYRSQLNPHRGKKRTKLCTACKQIEPHYIRKNGNTEYRCVKCTKKLLNKQGK